MGYLSPHLTNAGLSMFLGTLDGTGMEFTKIVLGKRTTAPADAAAVTAVAVPAIEAQLDSITFGSNYAVLSATVSNTGLATGFRLTEIGVYARPDGGSEALYAYHYEANDADFIPAEGSGRVVTVKLKVIVSVGDASEVSAVLVEGSLYASKELFEQHLAADNPHELTAEDVGLGNVVNAAPGDYEIAFETPVTLENYSSGDTLSSIIGKLRAAVTFLRQHLMDRNNPHAVTLAQLHAAADVHTHAAADITSGTLPIARGGTGATSAVSARSRLGAAAASHTHTLSNIENWPGIATVAETESYLGIE